MSRVEVLPTRFEVVAMAASTGGPQALQRLIENLPATGLAVPLLVVQHITHGFLDGLISWLQPQTALPLRIAHDGELLQPATIYFAPDNYHLQLTRRQQRLYARLDASPPLQGIRPSATRLFSSVAECCGTRAVGVILSGMGSDGADGLLALRRCGGTTLAQSEGSCVVFGMPSAAQEAGAVDRFYPPLQLAQQLLALCGAAPVIDDAKRLARAANVQLNDPPISTAIRSRFMKQILVVDDSATSRLLFRAHLPKQGYQLNEAKDLDSALQRVHEQRPDIVFLDYNMPERNGVEIAAAMRASGLDVRYYLLTANTQESVLREAEVAGISGVLEKPINAAKLHQMLEAGE